MLSNTLGPGTTSHAYHVGGCWTAGDEVPRQIGRLSVVKRFHYVDLDDLSNA